MKHRPVGPDKHWAMVSIALHLKANGQKVGRVEEGELWRKYEELYDVEVLEESWEEEVS